jgi:hypothetical protein
MISLALLPGTALLLFCECWCGTLFNVNGRPSLQVLALIFVASGLACIYGTFLEYRKYHALRDTQQMPIGSLVPGPVHIHGRAVGAEPLTSPITRLPCFYYEVMVEKWVEAGDQSAFQPCLRDTRHVEFHVEDATGKVLIDLRRAELDLSSTFEGQIGKHARKKRTVDPALRGWSQPSDLELLDYLSQANAKIRATSAAPSPASWPANIKQGIAAYVTMKSSHFAYQETSVSTLDAALPPGFEKELLRFTEKCLLPDREYNIVGTCIENPNPAKSTQGKLIARGGKESTFLISCKARPSLQRRAMWNIFLVFGFAVLFILAGVGLYVAGIP